MLQFRLEVGLEMTDSEDNDGHHNYTLNSDIVLRDAYRLLCVVMADRAIAEFARTDNLVSLRQQFVEDELVHTVIQLAVMNRTRLDDMNKLRSDPCERKFDPIERKCGELTKNVGANGGKECLMFREACNKIIHVKKIKVIPDENGDRPFQVLGRTVILRGTKNGNKWQADLNILEFLRGTFENFYSSA